MGRRDCGVVVSVSAAFSWNGVVQGSSSPVGATGAAQAGGVAASCASIGSAATAARPSALSAKPHEIFLRMFASRHHYLIYICMNMSCRHPQHPQAHRRRKLADRVDTFQSKAAPQAYTISVAPFEDARRRTSVHLLAALPH
jgi:hypothetical protein